MMKVQSGASRPSTQILTACLEAAVATPSVLNTQPPGARGRPATQAVPVLVA
jgi:hypothetical protein